MRHESVHHCFLIQVLLFLFAGHALAFEATASKGAPAAEDEHGPSSSRFPSHRFQLRPHAAHDVQLGVNFGLIQVELGGFNVSAELRYRRLWFAYQHGSNLTLNNAEKVGLLAVALSRQEREQKVHLHLPYSTGFGLGITVVDELWLGVEYTVSRFQVRVPQSATESYLTHSVGLVLGYRFFLWKGLFACAYVHYWPTLESSLQNERVTLYGSSGEVVHRAHSFGVYPNLSIGYAIDL